MPQSSKQDRNSTSHDAPKYDPPKLTIHGSIEKWTRAKSITRGESTHKT